jgi:hypothetical protein
MEVHILKTISEQIIKSKYSGIVFSLAWIFFCRLGAINTKTFRKLFLLSFSG